MENKWYQCKSTAKDVSFECSYHRVLLTDSKVRTTLHISIIDSGSEMVKSILRIVSLICVKGRV